MGKTPLLPSIHSLYVRQIVVLQLFPLQLERICDETSLRCPRLWTQMDFNWNLKPLEFNYMGEQRKKTFMVIKTNKQKNDHNI